MTDAERFDINRPNLCSALRSKAMLTWAEEDNSQQRYYSGYFWCLHTQTCLGPDGKLAEPVECDSPDRACHCQNSAQA
ncbi:MAG: hypothetical protein J2P31_00355 [Blastocatellia bacterium]|nr:hypothetical protein [Blastocatellia bacterium]